MKINIPCYHSGQNEQERAEGSDQRRGAGIVPSHLRGQYLYKEKVKHPQNR